jgi:hypothetical protein
LTTPSRQLTFDEQALVAFTGALLVWSNEASSASIKGQPSVDALKQFFSEQSDRLNAALQDAQSPPWLALHHAAVSLDVRRPVAHTGKAASD